MHARAGTRGSGRLGSLQVSDLVGDLAVVAADPLDQRFAVFAQTERPVGCEPGRNAATVVPASDVRTRAQHDAQPRLTARLDEAAQVCRPIEREPPLAGFVQDPGDRDFDRVETALSGVGNPIGPLLGGNPRVVKGRSDDE